MDDAVLTVPAVPGIVEVLPIYSLGYAAWRHWRTSHEIPSAVRPTRAAERCALPVRRTLVVVAAAVSIATMLVRPVFPFMSAQFGTLKLWQWPEYLALFGLGVVAAGRGWLDRVPDRIRRGCGFIALLAMVASAALTGAILAAGLD